MIQPLANAPGKRVRATRGLLGFALTSLLLAVGCSTENGEAPGSADPTTQGDGHGVSVLERLTGDKFCELLANADIEQQLEVKVMGSEGNERGRAPARQSPYFLTRECDYETDQFDLSTEISSQWQDDETDEQVLDEAFGDLEEGSAAADYQRIPGLGDAAGYAADPDLSDAGVARNDLVVVFRVGEERFSLTVGALGKPGQPQLQALAEMLLSATKTALG
ncbi:hypothetical protein EV191_10424 [Tamaricihabitans halophyticus]|uniref:DUF3558 domain-containing protein n=1 Tax=Tamaricihabitans halophyticus TaxID=1262583 RepID=A0A4R2QUQ6_9PSEU|nr:hypothetical protein [Tamaricihabitans halophyticus]TCP53457.1 hypothetical protein EV191_10424 [Tamaricihabitans halophyticus]